MAYTNAVTTECDDRESGSGLFHCTMCRAGRIIYVPKAVAGAKLTLVNKAVVVRGPSLKPNGRIQEALRAGDMRSIQHLSWLVPVQIQL